MFRRKTKLEKVLDKKSNYVTFRDFSKIVITQGVTYLGRRNYLERIRWI